MKKHREKKKSTAFDHKKQLSLRAFFTIKNDQASNNATCSPISFAEKSQNSVNEDRKITENEPASPDIIEATPESKLVSKISLAKNIKSNTKQITKKRLFADTLNSASICSDISETKSHDSQQNVPKLEPDLVDDGIRNQLLEEIENSPPKKCLPAPTKINTNCTNSFEIIRNNNTKRRKLSLCGSLKKNISFNVTCQSTDFDPILKKKNSLKTELPQDNSIMQRLNANIVKKELFFTSRKQLENRLPENMSEEKLEIEDLSVVNEKKTKESLIDIENLGDLFDEDWESHSLKELNLDKWNYCEITMIEPTNYGIVAQLKKVDKSRNSSLSTSCIIRGYWSSSPLKIGDVISIKGCYDTALCSWLVDEKHGFIIKHPDILVTGTGIVGSLFCLRQSVLSYLFPGADSQNISMLIGSLVHELFQEILKKKCYTEKDMSYIATDIIKRQRTLYLAYEFNVSLSTLQIEIEKFLPRIFTFVNMYITEKRSTKKMWSGTIQEILSIEENFWVPELGIKGKTDLIVKANQDKKTKILPIELKTGRASNSSEHRGQVLLYLMMMSELGIPVDSGLLLYLRENVLHEIKPQHSEYNGLITMRNNLVDFYVKTDKIYPSVEGTFAVPILPEPINHHSGCAKCPYLTVCSAALSEETDKKVSKDNPLNVLKETSIKHLSASHIRYIFHWLGLLKLEEMERKNDRFLNISDVWHLDPEERRTRGNCISKLMLINIEIYGNKFLHYFKRLENDYDFTSSRLSEGDYIIISEERRYAVATGYVYQISQTSICLKIDRELKKKENSGYIVDKYSVTEGLLGFNASSLFLLLENSNSAARLRSLIIDLELPLFSSIPVISEEDRESILSKLNIFQKEAVLQTIAANDYLLIKGMPGTGKTSTIIALVKLLVRLKCTILVTSQTHSAVDNILLRLNTIDFLRLGSNTRVHPKLKSYCEDHVLKSHSFQTIEDLEDFYNKKQVVGVTCMGCSHVLLKKRTFDYCIVDEATQVLQPSIFKALYSSRKFVLLGDPDQLPPVVQSREASLLGLSESLFKRLDTAKFTRTLRLQYRMNSEIMKLANLFAYDNLLQCDNDDVNSATIDCSDSSSVVNERNWLKRVLSGQLNHSVIFLNTADVSLSNPSSEYSNQVEADVTFIILDAIIQNRKKLYDIGVIAPYREQVELLRKIALGRNYTDIEINTVDQYQGRDKDIIIYSCTKFSNRKEGGILADKRRLTVAITRAKRKLVIIGNIPALETLLTFKSMLNFIPPNNIIRVIHV